MTISRIGGPMLKENLIRDGVDLSIETDLIYFDVNNFRIGINNSTPTVDLDLTGIARFDSKLQINGANIATYANNDNITLSPNGSGQIVFAGAVKQSAITAPASPASDSYVIYITASGTSPNREVAYKMKNEAGEEIIISSVLV